jgi:hypothetical protein
MARSKQSPWPMSILLLAALIMALPQQSNANVAAAVLCAVEQYPCIGANILDFDTPNDGANLLGGNTFDILKFNFVDAPATFASDLMATDNEGRWIYLWGSSTTTEVVDSALNLDVALTESYLTTPGDWTFNDVIGGACEEGPGAASGGAAQDNCSRFGPLVTTDAAVSADPGLIPTRTSAVELALTAASAAESTITSPWNEESPDPNDFNDPDNPPDDTDPVGDSNLAFSSAASEPATVMLCGVALCLFGLVRRRKPQ